MKRVGKRLGDTLVEVTIAIGIFSMVAVAVVSVVSGSTAGAQANLETTVAREEMDAQAEALRFIQDLYVTDGDSALWNEIVKKAKTASASNISFNVSSCETEIYNDKLLKDQNAFIINTKKLRDGNTTDIIKGYKDTGKDFFTAATTYPRIVYKSTKSDSAQGLLDIDSGTEISKVEGLYIVAVANASDGTIVVEQDVEKKSAYFDFYIRSCWYSPGSNTPTTISTVVRLYNPDVAINEEKMKPATQSVVDHIIFHANSDNEVNVKEKDKDDKDNYLYHQDIGIGNSQILQPNPFSSDDYDFVSWNTKKDGSGTSYADRQEYKNLRRGETSNKDVHLYAQWVKAKLIKIVFNKNGGSGSAMNQYIPVDRTRALKKNTYTRTYYDFSKWTTKKDGTGDSYADGANFKVKKDQTTDINLYAQWKERSHNNLAFYCGKAGTTDVAKVPNGNSAKWVYDGYPFTLYDISTVCQTPTGYSFENWKVEKCNALDSTYANGATYNYNSSCSNGVSLTAQWKQSLPPTLVVATGKTDNNCKDGIKLDPAYVTGTTHVEAGRWYSQGDYKSDPVSFNLNLGSYTKATVTVKAGANAPGCESSTWQKFDEHYWRSHGDWHSDAGGWCNSQGSNANATYTFEESGEHTLQAGGSTEHSGTWSNSCIVVTKITLSDLKK